jgi:hypothetical protein
MLPSGRSIITVFIVAALRLRGECGAGSGGRRDLMKLFLSVMLLMSLVHPMPGMPTTSTLPAVAAASCTTGLTLTLHPGLPSSMRRIAQPVARDIPRTPVTVSAPLYPGARPLISFVAPAIPEYPADPYLQTGVAEYRTADPVDPVKAWYRTAFASCGWRQNGSMQTNASVLDTGITFASNANRNLTMEMTFGDSPNGGTYIAYGVEAITYPIRPAGSYLHGPFRQMRITLDRTTMQRGRPVRHTVRRTLTAVPTIDRFVRDINAITEYHTVSGFCSGGLSLVGPAWLSFVRPGGSVVHAFESGPGGCAGLAVNGFRWFIDRGSLWTQIRATL